MKPLLTCLLAFATVACAGRSREAPTVEPATAGADVVTQSSASSSSRNRETITAEELADPALANVDLHSVIQRLRPAFLTGRGMVSLRGGGGGIRVSIDGSALTDLSELRSLRASEVKEVRFLTPSAAAQVFGTRAANSAVIAVTRR